MAYIKIIISIALTAAVFGGGLYAELTKKPSVSIDNLPKKTVAETGVEMVEQPEEQVAVEPESIQSKLESLILGAKTKSSSTQTDLVPSPAPAVTSLPDEAPTSATWDFCSNLEGNQTVLPDGYYRANDNNCFPKTGTWDFCLNLFPNQLLFP